jgi:hypothetical protein
MHAIMSALLNESFGAFLQILTFAMIPFLVYLIQHKSTKGFFNYLGLKKSTRKANILALLVCLIFMGPILILTMTSLEFKDIMFDPKSITGKFRNYGFWV